MNVQRTLRRLSTAIAFTLLIVLFVVFMLWRHMVITVPAGHAGVMWWRFFGGTDVIAAAKEEGVHLIFPWDELIIYDSRLQEHTEVFSVVANNGLNLEVTASIRWRARKTRLGELHRSIGPDYLRRLLLPEVGSVLRETISRYKAEDLYANDRHAIQETIYRSLLAASGNGIGGVNEEPGSANMISLLDVLLAEVTLPESLQAAIERKFAQAELVEEFRFRVQREELESKRKEVEAKGIRTFQEIVTPTISDAYLRWTGIEATLKLAQSPNSKVVIVGNGPGGLPVILNGFESEKPTAATTPAMSNAPATAPATVPAAAPEPLMTPSLPPSVTPQAADQDDGSVTAAHAPAKKRPPLRRRGISPTAPQGERLAP
jgi:regulator of protease activity HflC (stomatin/prohibitin superfamily)